MIPSPDLSNAPVRRRYVDVSFGQVHAAESGPTASDRLPVVLLHQAPRSWDEYREVLPRLGRDRRAIAFDTPGMGASDAVVGEQTIEAFAVGLTEAIDALGIDRFHLVGHHTGGLIAFEIAATNPTRIGRLVLSSTPWIDAEVRATRRSRPAVDAVTIDGAGRHLTELWQGRRPFYPNGRPDLLQRFVRDALATTDPAAGHRAVGDYCMERRVAELADVSVLLVGHADDPFAFPDLEPMHARLPHAQIAVIEGGMVPLELTASDFAEIVAGSLVDLDAPGWPDFTARLVLRTDEVDASMLDGWRIAGVRTESWGDGFVVVVGTTSAANDTDAVVAIRARLRSLGAPEPVRVVSVRRVRDG